MARRGVVGCRGRGVFGLFGTAVPPLPTALPGGRCGRPGRPAVGQGVVATDRGRRGDVDAAMAIKKRRARQACAGANAGHRPGVCSLWFKLTVVAVSTTVAPERRGDAVKPRYGHAKEKVAKLTQALLTAGPHIAVRDVPTGQSRD